MTGRAYHNELPLLYTGGFASVDLVNRSRDKNNILYHSMFPDVYSGIVLAWNARRFAALLRPVAIAGASAHSTGAAQFRRSRYRRPFEQYYAEDNIPNHECVAGGPITSLTMVYYECYLQSEHLHNNWLKVSIEDQLALATSDSDGTLDERAYLERVAARNGLNVPRLSNPSPFDVARWRVRRLRARWGRRVVQGAHGASNVLEAACVSSSIWSESHWRTMGGEPARVRFADHVLEGIAMCGRRRPSAVAEPSRPGGCASSD
jgi:hypothetical protein